MVALALVMTPVAPAAQVRVVTSSPFSTERAAMRGAVGLMVPGKGPTVSREETLEALGHLPSCRRCELFIWVSLPPPGEHHNVTRYPVAIFGRGYHGLLVSDRTRIPGLISVFDIAPTVRALERGKKPPVTSRADADAPRTLHHLDRTLTRAHDARDPAMLLMISLLVAYGLAGLFLRSRLLARAAVLVPPVALASSLVLSGAGAQRPGLVVTVLGIVTGIGSLAGAALLRDPRALAAAFVALLLAYLVVMWAWPVTNSLAVIGPHPDGGGRYYGVTNEMSTLLLAPAFLAASLLGRAFFVPVAVLALVTVGASFSGADGGGAVTLLAGFLVLGVRVSGMKLTWRRLALVGAATVALALAFVGLDAALGGSSHVTRAFEGGPGTIAGDIGHRLHISWDGATSPWYHVLLMLIAFAGLAWAGTRKPRSAVVDALLVAIVVSLLVNDTPVDVAGFGALSAMTVASWRRTEPRLE
ncbi:MAG TPA: hypothetical protein VF895_03080 [Gaiellaceae bacterium]